MIDKADISFTGSKAARAQSSLNPSINYILTYYK